MNEGDDWVPTPYEEGITIVPLWSAQGGRTTTRRGTSVDLGADELPAETVAELAGSAVSFTCPVDLTTDELATLRDALSVPDAFEKTGWLTDHHALVLDEGRKDLRGFSVVYHPQRGLEIAE